MLANPLRRAPEPYALLWHDYYDNGDTSLELLLSRSQRPGFSSITFVLDVRTRLSEDENALVSKYKLGKEILYQKEAVSDKLAEQGVYRRLLTLFTAKAVGAILTSNDLLKGKTIVCKDILEMMDNEEQLKRAAGGFYAILQVCRGFEGEEVITYPLPA
jgi:hypothetical protein